MTIRTIQFQEIIDAGVNPPGPVAGVVAQKVGMEHVLAGFCLRVTES